MTTTTTTDDASATSGEVHPCLLCEDRKRPFASKLALDRHLLGTHEVYPRQHDAIVADRQSLAAAEARAGALETHIKHLKDEFERILAVFADDSLSDADSQWAMRNIAYEALAAAPPSAGGDMPRDVRTGKPSPLILQDIADSMDEPPAADAGGE